MKIERRNYDKLIKSADVLLLIAIIIYVITAVASFGVIIFQKALNQSDKFIFPFVQVIIFVVSFATVSYTIQSIITNKPLTVSGFLGSTIIGGLGGLFGARLNDQNLTSGIVAVGLQITNELWDELLEAFGADYS